MELEIIKVFSLKMKEKNLDQINKNHLKIIKVLDKAQEKKKKLKWERQKENEK